jgi:hypothetical protein
MKDLLFDPLGHRGRLDQIAFDPTLDPSLGE